MASTRTPGPAPTRPASATGADNSYDLALIVALPEEFDWLEEELELQTLPPIDGQYYYVAHLGGYRILVHKIGDMGLLLATLAVTKLLNNFQVEAIILLGIAGSLDDKACIGDVIVAKQIDHYLHAAKAVESGSKDGTWQFESSGLVFPTAEGFCNLADNFSSYNKAAFQQWRGAARAFLEDSELPDPDDDALPCRPQPALHIGPVASGEFVVATNEFIRQLKARNRKHLAVEMEAGGVALAAQAHHSAIPLLVVRGVSDLADTGKRQLEEGRASLSRELWQRGFSLRRRRTDGNAGWPPNFWRHYSFFNALEWVRQLVMCPDFHELIPPSGAPAELDTLDSQLNFNSELTKPKELNDLVQQVKTSSKEETRGEGGAIDPEVYEAFEAYVSDRLRAAPDRQVLEKTLLRGAYIKLDIEEGAATRMLDEMIAARVALRKNPYIIRPPDLDWSANDPERDMDN